MSEKRLSIRGPAGWRKSDSRGSAQLLTPFPLTGLKEGPGGERGRRVVFRRATAGLLDKGRRQIRCVK